MKANTETRIVAAFRGHWKFLNEGCLACTGCDSARAVALHYCERCDDAHTYLSMLVRAVIDGSAKLPEPPRDCLMTLMRATALLDILHEAFIGRSLPQMEQFNRRFPRARRLEHLLALETDLLDPTAAASSSDGTNAPDQIPRLFRGTRSLYAVAVLLLCVIALGVHGVISSTTFAEHSVYLQPESFALQLEDAQRGDGKTTLPEHARAYSRVSKPEPETEAATFPTPFPEPKPSAARRPSREAKLGEPCRFVLTSFGPVDQEDHVYFLDVDERFFGAHCFANDKAKRAISFPCRGRSREACRVVPRELTVREIERSQSGYFRASADKLGVVVEGRPERVSVELPPTCCAFVSPRG